VDEHVFTCSSYAVGKEHVVPCTPDTVVKHVVAGAADAVEISIADPVAAKP
jgi:hypothetical protein